MMNKKAIATTTIVLVLVVIVLGAGLIYYATIPSPTPPPPPPGPATVTGAVTDAKTGDPIAGATVEANGYRATTGPDGVYLLSVKVGTYTVTASIEGYETKTSSVSASEEKTYTADVSLSTIPLPTPEFVKNNELIFETDSTYQWFDPHISYYQYDYDTLWHTVEMLLWYKRESSTEIIPWLAESYEMITPKQYEFKLREGIQFQDGTPFNATAVWFSLNRILIIDGTSATGVHGSQAAWMVQQLLDTSLSTGMSGEDQPYDTEWVQKVLDQNFVEIVDDYTVRLNLVTPTTQFLPILAGPWAAIISPTSTIAADYEHGGWGIWDGDYNTYFEHMAGNGDTALNLPENGWKIGTGPYIFESVDPTTYEIVLKADPGYWGGPDKINLPPEGKTRIETIRFVYQPSFTTRLLNLKAGKVTAIDVGEVDIFSVADRDEWIENGVLESIVQGVTIHGVFPTFNTWWFDFNTNVTTPEGKLRDWQPFADWRIRMAVACAVNMTHMNIYVNNRLSIPANNIIPPGTVPEGSYNPDVKPVFSYDLELCEELLRDAMENPLTEFTYYNGTKVPPGVIDNSFGPDQTSAKTVELYVQSGSATFQKVLTTIAENLNTITRENNWGLRFAVVPVPGGQQYTLASMHRIDGYMGGWIADYNHVMNWLQPMYLSTGTYPSWNLWNLTSLDNLYWQAVAADEAGDFEELLRLNNEMNEIANEALTYMVWWHDTEFFTRSSWLKGWYFNTNYGDDLWSAMYYEQP